MTGVPADDDRDPVEVLAEEFVARHRRGERPTVDEYADRHPDHAPSIRALFPTLLAMEGLKESTQSRPRALPEVPHLERLGDYRILEEIGRGGMGIVFAAEQESLGRRVALKVLPRQAILDERRRERFHREARTAARLHHTNIVPIFGTGEDDGHHYYVMQLIPGVGLDRVLAVLCGEAPEPAPDDDPRLHEAVRRLCVDGDAGPPGAAYWDAIARLGAQIADALAYAHSQGVLHRDVKPGNLLLDEQGTAWITDFGLAKALEQDDLTGSGDLVGTLRYMAPEQTQGRYDARSDQYALGLTLYELAARRPAFSGRARSQILEQIRRGEPTPLARIAPGIPRDLATVIGKACAADPSHRYATAADLAGDLERFVTDRPVRARRITRIEHLWRWCRRNRLTAGLAASTAAAVLVAAVTGWLAYGVTNEALTESRAARQQAEGYLALSLEAFEDVFDAVSGQDVSQPVVENPETGEFEVVPSAAVDEEDAALLERLLEFYERFAARNAGSRTLRREAARAHRRVGDIHAHLGNREEGRRAYERALELYRTLPARTAALESAVVHNELGQLVRPGSDRATAAHRRALELLADRRESPPDPAVRLELARTHRLLGSSLAFSRRRDEEVRAHYRTALEHLAVLLASAPDNPTYRFAEARVRWRLAIHLRDEDHRGAEGLEEKALATLRDLVESYRRSGPYCYELAHALSFDSLWSRRWRGRRERDHEKLAEEADRLQQALYYVEVYLETTRQDPGTPFRVLRWRLLMALAHNARERGDVAPDRIEGYYRTAIDEVGGRYATWSLRRFAEWLRDQDRREEALELLDRALESTSDHRERTLRRLHDERAEVLEELGRDEEAARARAEARRLREEREDRSRDRGRGR